MKCVHAVYIACACSEFERTLESYKAEIQSLEKERSDLRDKLRAVAKESLVRSMQSKAGAFGTLTSTPAPSAAQSMSALDATIAAYSKESSPAAADYRDSPLLQMQVI